MPKNNKKMISSMAQYGAICRNSDDILRLGLMVSYTFTGYKNNCHPLKEMPPAAHEYKQLHSGNHYHPLDLPDLTVDSRAFRNQTDFHKTSKSSSLGYSARHLELNIPKEKLKTKFPPFVHKPKVTEEPAPIDKQTAIRALPLWPTTRTDEHGNKYKHFDFCSK